MEFPNIVLVGARGSGKSRAARKLAAAIGWKRIQTDGIFEARHGPIPEFVAASGWDAFRQREADILQELAEAPPERSIVDCGGGVVELPETRARLRRLGTVYWMRAPLARLRERVARKSSRPSLTGRDPVEEIGEVLVRRTPLYRAVADADVWSESGTEAAKALRRAHFGPGIALSAQAGDAEDAIRAIRDAAERAGPADLLELRADRMEEAALETTLQALPEAVREHLILTVRTAEEGGAFRGSPEEWARMLLAGARAGVRFVDAEAAASRIRIEAPNAGILASHHHLKGPLPDLEALARRLERNADAIKVAATATGFADVRKVSRFLAEPGPVPRIGVAMGAAGTALRVLGGEGDIVATFAPPPESPPTAPGQLDADAIRDRHRRWGRKLRAPVPVYGVVGWPVADSLSPPLHEAALAHAGREASYQRFEVPPDELDDFLTAARLCDEVAGLNVTIPLKERVVPLLDSLDEAAHRIGAVNTILRVRDQLIGANTDWLGAARALLEVAPLSGKRATVLGAGGSARAVLHGLREHGALPTVIARNDRKAAQVAARFDADWTPAGRIGEAAGDILINTTPVGMDDDRSPAPPETVRRHRVVFDLVYRPRRTRLLAEAEVAGALPLPGLPMLIHQAAASLSMWTGVPAEEAADIMRKTASELDAG